MEDFSVSKETGLKKIYYIALLNLNVATCFALKSATIKVFSQLIVGTITFTKNKENVHNCPSFKIDELICAT